MMTITELAEKCSDAYSTDRYRNGWRGCVRMLRRRGLTDRQIEAVIRSKWTRWAGDASDNKYGRLTSTDLERFMDSQKDYWGDQMRQLTLETFGAEE